MFLLHTSIPANPVLANPLYLAGYIERLGIGTSDMVDECLAMGLKAPEFVQDSNFRAILWRKNDPSSTIKLNKKQKMVLEYCAVYAKSSREILEHLNIYNNSRSREKYITQLVLAGLLRPTKPKSNDPDQRYIATAGNGEVHETDC